MSVAAQLFDANGLPANVVPKLSNAEYHKLDSISNSRMKIFRESRKKYFAMFIRKTMQFEQTKDMLLGSVVHAMMLEPDQLASLYRPAPKCDRRTKAGKAAWKAFVDSVPEGCQVIDADMWEQASLIRYTLDGDGMVRSFMDTIGECELPLFWNDPDTGIACRAKLDKACHEIDVILDYKIVQDSTPEGFARACVKYEYDCQAAHYCEGYARSFGVFPNFVFIAISKTPPFEIGFYELTEGDLSQARQVNIQTMQAIQMCQESGIWTSQHESKVVKLKLPRYVNYRNDYTDFESDSES